MKFVSLHVKVVELGFGKDGIDKDLVGFGYKLGRVSGLYFGALGEGLEGDRIGESLWIGEVDACRAGVAAGRFRGKADNNRSFPGSGNGYGCRCLELVFRRIGS